MRKIIVILCALLIGCAMPGLAVAGRMQVAVGVAPMQHFAQKIGGNLIQTTVLVPAGADAHTYEPKPSQMRAIAGASVYLSTGLEFEEAWEARLKGANPRMAFIHTDEGLKKMVMPEHHEEHAHTAAHGHEEVEMDPHIWVAPSMVRQMVVKVADAFAKADPAHAKVYAANLSAYLKEIDAVDAQLKGLFAGIPADKRTFLVFHPAWGYLARDYGLTQSAIEFEGKEPTPRHLAAIISQGKAKNVKAVFVQPQMSQRTAATIAQAIGAKLVVADPLAENWEANLLNVAKSFRQALQ
jgi:zinc transport system substrate-binding protein